MTSPFDPLLEIFFGRTTESECRVYARLAANGEQGLQLRGRIIGPECRYAHTLPTTYPLVDRGTSAGPPLAEALLPDPCFWTPTTPHLYRVEVEVQRGGKLLDGIERSFGIRLLGAADGNLIFAGQRWVVRGVSRQSVPATPLEQWRETATAMVVMQPDDELCAEASRAGVVLVAELEGSRPDLLGELRRLARWPAIALAVLPGTNLAAADIRSATGNLLLAQALDRRDTCEPADWAAAIILSADDLQAAAARAGKWRRPVIAQRLAGHQPTLGEARHLCDILQRDLARFGQFAGYLV